MDFEGHGEVYTKTTCMNTKITVLATLFTNYDFEQVRKQADVYRTTTTNSRPVRSKPGVPSRNLLPLSTAGY